MALQVADLGAGATEQWVGQAAEGLRVGDGDPAVAAVLEDHRVAGPLVLLEDLREQPQVVGSALLLADLLVQRQDQPPRDRERG
ncbi:MAG: hypothetical protein ABIS86_09270 [Streptosporangiaceae bacterium]